MTFTVATTSLELLYQRRSCDGFDLKPCMKKRKQEEEQQQQNPPAFITNLTSLQAKSLTTNNDDKDDDESDSITAPLTLAMSMDDEEDDDCCFRATETTTTTTCTKKNVRFDTVEIRHYGRTVDDHPCTQCGPALTLTWTVEQEEKLTIETFECIRNEQQRVIGNPPPPPPRRLGAPARQKILLRDWKVPAVELRNAMYVSQLIRKQRRETLQALRDM